MVIQVFKSMASRLLYMVLRTFPFSFKRLFQFLWSWYLAPSGNVDTLEMLRSDELLTYPVFIFVLDMPFLHYAVHTEENGSLTIEMYLKPTRAVAPLAFL